MLQKVVDVNTIPFVEYISMNKIENNKTENNKTYIFQYLLKCLMQ